MKPIQTYQLLYSKGNHKQSAKTSYRLEENICKWCNHKGLICKICKQLLQFNNKQKKKKNKKMGRRPKWTFLQRRHTLANGHMERCSSLLIIREMQVKTVRSYLTPVRMAIIKNLQIIDAGEGVEEREPSYAISGNVNWHSHYGKTVWKFFKVQKVYF